jgi:very-short-patch-repair endonuclease
MPQKCIVTGQIVAPELLQRAKELRQNMTPAEKMLRHALKADHLAGYHFRRQQVIGGYIVDFFCFQTDLVVELDGEIHFQQLDYDTERDHWLESVGLRVLRFKNEEVLGDQATVLGMIYDACDLPPELPKGRGTYPPTPSLKGGGAKIFP